MRTLAVFAVTVLCVVSIGVAAVTCEDGCNESVIALVFTAYPGGPAGCRTYDKSQCATLSRVTRRQGDECGAEVQPTVTVTWYNCSGLNNCVALCTNEIAGGTNQRTQSSNVNVTGCVSGTESRKECTTSE